MLTPTKLAKLPSKSRSLNRFKCKIDCTWIFPNYKQLQMCVDYKFSCYFGNILKICLHYNLILNNKFSRKQHVCVSQFMWQLKHEHGMYVALLILCRLYRMMFLAYLCCSGRDNWILIRLFWLFCGENCEVSIGEVIKWKFKSKDPWIVIVLAKIYAENIKEGVAWSVLVLFECSGNE